MAHAREIYQDNSQKGDLSTRVKPQKAQTADNELSVVSGDVSNKDFKISSKHHRMTKRNQKTGNSMKVEISMVRLGCECE